LARRHPARRACGALHAGGEAIERDALLEAPLLVADLLQARTAARAPCGVGLDRRPIGVAQLAGEQATQGKLSDVRLTGHCAISSPLKRAKLSSRFRMVGTERPSRTAISSRVISST